MLQNNNNTRHMLKVSFYVLSIQSSKQSKGMMTRYHFQIETLRHLMLCDLLEVTFKQYKLC